MSDFGFGVNYRDARERFVRAASPRARQLAVEVNPCGPGADGEPLASDVAWFGELAATRVLVVISGLHGTEGFAGSAAQIAWIERHGSRALPADVAVLMLHAVNPWGFSHRSRCNENFVDLNRNFVDHGNLPADAPLSAEVHAAVCIDRLDTETVDAGRRQLADLRLTHGELAVERALWGGQYSRPFGLSFGGSRPEWSTAMIRRVLRDRLAHVTHLAFIDWHTGVGDFGEVAFIVPAPARATDQRELARWWGEEAVSAWTRSGLSQVGADGTDLWSVVPGQLRNDFARMFQPTFLAGATVEFGLTLQEDIFEIETVSRYLHLTGRHLDPKFAPHLERMLTYSLSSHPDWRRNVLETGAWLTQAAIDGLAELRAGE